MSFISNSFVERARGISPSFHFRALLLLALLTVLVAVCVGASVFLSVRNELILSEVINTPSTQTLNKNTLMSSVRAYEEKRKAFEALVNALPPAPQKVTPSPDVTSKTPVKEKSVR